MAAGADFVVSPVVNPEVAAIAKKAGLLLDIGMYDTFGDLPGAAA